MLSKKQFMAFYLGPMVVFFVIQFGMSIYYELGLRGMSTYGLAGPLLEARFYASSPDSIGGRLVLPIETRLLMPGFLLFLCGAVLYLWYATGVFRRFTGWPQRIGCLAVAVVPYAIGIAILMTMVTLEEKNDH